MLSRYEYRSRTGTRALERRGFTLVELLVVIGIIAALISILLPTVNRARASAVGVQCRANLHSLGEAFTMYAQANRNTICFYVPKDSSMPTSATNPMTWWFGSITAPGMTASFGPTGGLIYPYCKTDLVHFLDDPATQNEGLSPSSNTYAGTTISPAYGIPNQLSMGYAYNGDTGAYQSPVPVPYGLRLNSVQIPTQTVLMADAALAGNGSYQRSSYVYEPIYGNGVSSPFYTPSFQGRHLHRGNVLWFDGHVTAEPVTYGTEAMVPNTSLMKKVDVGFLTPSNDITTLNANYYFFLNKTAHNLNTGNVW